MRKVVSSNDILTDPRNCNKTLIELRAALNVNAGATILTDHVNLSLCSSTCAHSSREHRQRRTREACYGPHEPLMDANSSAGQSCLHYNLKKKQWRPRHESPSTKSAISGTECHYVCMLICVRNARPSSDLKCRLTCTLGYSEILCGPYDSF